MQHRVSSAWFRRRWQCHRFSGNQLFCLTLPLSKLDTTFSSQSIVSLISRQGYFYFLFELRYNWFQLITIVNSRSRWSLSFSSCSDRNVPTWANVKGGVLNNSICDAITIRGTWWMTSIHIDSLLASRIFSHISCPPVSMLDYTICCCIWNKKYTIENDLWYLYDQTRSLPCLSFYYILIRLIYSPGQYILLCITDFLYWKYKA